MDKKVKLIKKELVAEGTMAFHFNKPDGFIFKSGQHIDIKLINPPETDSEGDSRTFSLASAPYENELMIATRMRDTAFKRALKNYPPGTEVLIDGPFGSMTLHNDISKPAVLLSGGIGITPFLSMAREATHNKLPHRLFLFYSNRRPEDSPYLQELTDLEGKNPSYKFIATMTQMEKSKNEWNGETGYITKEMIIKYLPEPQKAVFYIAGPPAMVSSMLSLLNDLDIDTDFIKTEEFAGY